MGSNNHTAKRRARQMLSPFADFVDHFVQLCDNRLKTDLGVRRRITPDVERQPGPE